MLDDVGTNVKSVAQLVMEGTVSICNRMVKSPINKVTRSDMPTGRWRFWSHMSDAEDLISFA